MRSMNASARSGPSGVPRRYRSVIVPVNFGWVSPSLAASPRMWSSTSAQMPPCTQPGGPSYAAPSVNSLQHRPSSS